MPPFRPRVIVLALFLSVLAAVPFFIRAAPRENLYFLELSLVTRFPGTLQVFYDSGRGFNETDSQRQPLVVATTPQVYRFPLPSGLFKGLRIDPTNFDHPVTCAGLRIRNQGGQVIREFSLEQFRPTNQLTLHPHPAGLEMRPTPGSSDPFSELRLEGPIPLSYTPDLLDRLRVSVPVFLTVFLVVWLAGAASAGDLGWRPAGLTQPVPTAGWREPRAWWLAGGMGVAIGLKFWLVAAQSILAVGGAGHDDQLFIDLAANIAEGRWLGPYSQFTLMKGPLYSVFLALTYKLGLPLFSALHAGYAAACVLLVVALRPLVPHRGVRFGLFVLLLFNPVTFESVVNARILRQNLLPLLTFLIVAGLIGLYARRAAAPRRLLPWALLTGLALPAFWLTREESVWFLPAIALLWGPVILAVARDPAPGRRARLLLLALPAVLWAAGVGAVAAVNLRYYGLFTTCEFKHPAFKDAFGALLRIEPEPRLPYIAVPRATREQLYELSPAFAELRPYLEGSWGQGWAASSETLTHIPAEQREIATGWFMWALRDAVALAGHCEDGAKAMAFYTRMAREINAACDAGKIKAGPPRSGFMPALGREFAGPALREFANVGGFFFTFAEMHTTPQFSMGTPEQLADFARLTHGKLGRLPTDPVPTPAPAYQLRLDTLARISAGYQAALPWVGGASFLAWVAAVCVMLTRRRLAYLVCASTGLLGSVLALIAAIALIQITSFPAINTGYFSGSYGVWLLFCGTAWLALAEVLRRPAPGAR